jgi:uncharacterized membrane protein YraQ (UPF0718 family)
VGWLWTLSTRVAGDVLATFEKVWPFLTIAIVIAAAVPVYVGVGRVSRLMRRRWWVATIGAVVLATLTPFCSCGTTAVLLGMIATSSPWAPLVAFMVSSPLTSPSELVFSAGLFGWSFALLFFGGTIGLGLGAGLVAHLLDRAGWLEGQARVPDDPATESDTGERSGRDERVGQDRSPTRSPRSTDVTLATIPRAPRSLTEQMRLEAFGRELWGTGRRILLFFVAYTTVGYLVIEAVPTSWLTDHLGGDSMLAVPLAALIGVPAYINTEGSLPMVSALVDGGMGAGPALAFIVTGAGTSVGAISGLFVIARGRVVALVVALLFSGALVLGWTGQLVL